mgnify:CR=1 FL=1
MTRISSQINNSDTQYHLRRQEVNSNRLSNQIGNQSRISSLRDDPIAAGHLVRYQSYQGRVERFEKNAQTLADQFNVREGYINQNLQIMQRVRELAVGGASGTYTPDDLKNMAAGVQLQSQKENRLKHAPRFRYYTEEAGFCPLSFRCQKVKNRFCLRARSGESRL